jgi:hypothetical protein
VNCKHVRARIGDHLEGDLELAERARVDEHLAACPACAVELRELRATVALLRGLADPEQPAGLPEKVLARIDAGEGRQAAWVRGIWRVAEPRVAAALAAGLAGLFVLANFETDASPGRVDRPDTGIVLTTGTGPVADVFSARTSRPFPPSWTPATRVRDREDQIRSVVAMVAIGPTGSLHRSPQPPPPVTRPSFFGQADFGVRPASHTPTR